MSVVEAIADGEDVLCYQAGLSKWAIKKLVEEEEDEQWRNWLI